MNFIISAMMEENFIISGQRKKKRLVIHKTFEVYGCSDCSGCRHKEKCLYKYCLLYTSQRMLLPWLPLIYIGCSELRKRPAFISFIDVYKRQIVSCYFLTPLHSYPKTPQMLFLTDRIITYFFFSIFLPVLPGKMPVCFQQE